ncbi:MAG: hypothetical protein ACKVX7_14355 [Planctomycetota bacterium]
MRFIRWIATAAVAIVFAIGARSDVDAQIQGRDQLTWPNDDTNELLDPPGGGALPSAFTGLVRNVVPIGVLDPFSLAIIAPQNILLVTDRTTPIVGRYDLDLVLLDVVQAPFASPQAVAYNSVAAQLAWINIDFGLLLVTSLALTGGPGGVGYFDLVGSFPLVLPPLVSNVCGLTYDPATQTYWAVDPVSDVIFELTEQGVWTGRQFTHPDRLSPSRGAFGTGVSSIPGSPMQLIVAGGLTFERGVTRLHTADTDSVCANTIARTLVFDELNGIAGIDSAIAGIAWHATGSGAGRALYLIGGATRVLIEIGALPIDCPFATACDLSCEPGTGTVVTLNWSNLSGYSSIAVFRDEALIQTLPATMTSFVNDPGQPGVYVYQLRLLNAAAVSCDGPRCTVIVREEGGETEPCSGPSPWGIAVVESRDQIYVADLMDRGIRVYDRNLNLVDTIFRPSSVLLTTGIAWRPDGPGGALGTLYWIETDGENSHQLIEANVDAVVSATYVLGNPVVGFLGDTFPGEGVPGGMDLNADGTALIVNDIQTDAYYTIDFDGSAPSTEPLFVNPDDMFGSGAFGNGFARLPAGAGFLINIGPNPSSFLGPDRILRLNDQAGTTDVEIPLGPGEQIDDVFVTDIKASIVPPIGAPPGTYVYAVGEYGCAIYSTALAASTCEAPRNLTCTVTGDMVTVSWENPSPTTYSKISVSTDGDIQKTGTGTLTTTTMIIDELGCICITVSAVCSSNGETVEISCKVCVLEGATDLIFTKEDTTGGTTDSTEALYAALTDDGIVVAKTSDLSVLSLSQFTTIWVVLGTFPASQALTPSEGYLLCQFVAAGGCLYIESSDAWGFDPATPFFECDGVKGRESDGTVIADGDDSLTEVIGESFGGLDLLGVTGDFTSDQGASTTVDRLEPTAPPVFPSTILVDVGGGSAGVVLRSGGSPSYVIGTYYAPPGFGKVIATSWEFGGFGGDREEMLGRMIDVLSTPAGSLFQRGDFNTDGMYNIADPISTLSYLFSGGSPPGCFDSCDVNDDGGCNVGDAIYTLSALFNTPSPEPMLPFPDCGLDPTADALDCAEFAICP